MASIYENITRIDKAYLGMNEIDSGAPKAFLSPMNTYSNSTYLTFPPGTNISVYNGNLHGFFNFAPITNLRYVDVRGLDTSKVTNTVAMFHGGYGVVSPYTILVANLDMTNVTNAYSQFSFLNTTGTIDVSGLNYVKALDTSYMFYNCTKVRELNSANFNLSNSVTTVSMFYQCTNLQSIQSSNWDLNNVQSTSSMFFNCSNLTTLDTSNWGLSKLQNPISMFSGCSNLTSIDTSNWDTSNITTLTDMFNSCQRLTSLNTSNWNTSKITDLRGTFKYCSSLTTLDTSNWNTSKFSSCDALFLYCYNLQFLDVSNWDTSNIILMQQMFQSCSSLIGLDMSNWNTDKVMSTQYTFFNTKASTFTFPNTGFSNVTDAAWMFQQSDLTQFNFGWNLNKLTRMDSMFQSCNNLVYVNLSSSSVVDAKQAFMSSALTSVDLNLPNLNNGHYLFHGCRNLTSINTLVFPNVTYLCNAFYNCLNLSQNSYNVIANALPNANQLTNQYLSNQGLDPNKFDWDQIVILNQKGYLDAIPDPYQIWYTTPD